MVRESIGKTTAKKLRRDGYLTANLYANGVENIQAAFKRGEFMRAVRNKDSLAFPVKVGDKELNVVIQEYQLHPVHGEVVHVDLRITVPGQVTDFLVPVVTHGTPIGLKNKGVLVMSKRRVKVRGAIENMPAKFDLNVEPLNRDDSLLIRDIEVPTDCKMLDRPDVAVCGVIKAK
ncbi:MAG: 50S ribosomal protein L25/general stress protein Ctc [Epsilonproteobacteria bacterium 4484_20]|nr:MAG: 50S ribosomal protein L25/general stress protein Ctc [Epsilonproteobacteria bacterium 4484_20]